MGSRLKYQAGRHGRTKGGIRVIVSTWPHEVAITSSVIYELLSRSQDAPFFLLQAYYLLSAELINIWKGLSPKFRLAPRNNFPSFYKSLKSFLLSRIAGLGATLSRVLEGSMSIAVARSASEMIML